MFPFYQGYKPSLNLHHDDIEGIQNIYAGILVLKHDFTVAESSQFKDGTWSSYKNGFGSANQKIFWLGLEEMHRLTSTGKWRLKVKVKWDKTKYPEGTDS